MSPRSATRNARRIDRSSDSVLLGELVTDRQRHEDPLAPKWLSSKALLTERTRQDRDVDGARVQPGKQHVAIGLDALDFNARICIVPVHHSCTKVASRHRAVVAEP